MKTLRLVSRGAKVSCIICAVVIATAGIAWIALRFSVGALLAFLAAAALFAVYVYIVFSSKAEYVPDSGILRLCGMQSAEIPLEGVVSVSSREVTVHGTVSRVIVLLGSGGAELAAIPVICGGRGYAAERMAKELAQLLSLRFDAAVPEYLYDRKAAKAHKKAEKAARPVEVTSFENDLQAALGTKVEVKYGKNMKKGTLVIHYHSLDELDNIAGRLKNKML